MFTISVTSIAAPEDPSTTPDVSSRILRLMARRRVIESIDGSVLPMRNAILFRRKGRFWLDILRPGRYMCVLMFWGLMTLLFMTLLAKFALLNTLHDLKLDRSEFITARSVEISIRANKLITEGDSIIISELKEMPLPPKLTVENPKFHI